MNTQITPLFDSSFILSFDIGHASIGWCVLADNQENPDFKGAGVVTFPSDDCLVSKRRQYRRSRRHIRATRQRIERLKRWLEFRKILSRSELDLPGHPAPFLLAAAALRGKLVLNALQLWHVLRWYAHNRGYDGNSRWSSQGQSDVDAEEDEDHEKLNNALELMKKHGTSSMAETVCALLQLNPDKPKAKIASHLPYKTLNAAFPRRVIEAEVTQLIEKHLSVIPGLDEETSRFLLEKNQMGEEERKLLLEANIRILKRYHGGLLFGQLVPRFDNRIIARCPITWAKVYDEALAEGLSDPKARQKADKFAKVPNASSIEFLEYRFARILANLRANDAPLSRDLRHRLWEEARKEGVLTAKTIEKLIQEAHTSNAVTSNVENYFKLHPDSEKALVLDPVQTLVTKAQGNKAKFSPVWKHLSPELKAQVIEQWKGKQSVSVEQILQWAGADSDLRDRLEKEFSEGRAKKAKKASKGKETSWIQLAVSPDFPDGRAPYSRVVMKQVVEEILAGMDPSKPSKDRDPQLGEEKPQDGVLYAMLNPQSRARQLMAERPLDQLTNNHLVRHRLLILERLIQDILSTYAIKADQKIRVVIEVARELKEFSGLDSKKIASALNEKLKDFRNALKYLETHAPGLLKNSVGKGTLLRKCRIAMDLGWTCPFTGKPYSAYDLAQLEREHIIPYANRSTNALHALVLTWPEVNRFKGKRTAKQFIRDCGGQNVPGKSNLCILSEAAYQKLIEKLDTKGHADDVKRKKARKALLDTLDMKETDLGFTEGQLTQTSQLLKLAVGRVQHALPQAKVETVPGIVNAEIRKTWNLFGTLAEACPEILDAEGNVRPKSEIRDITHLHHALDAATLALASYYIPTTYQGKDIRGPLWKALANRRKTAEDIEWLKKIRVYQVNREKDANGNEVIRGMLRELPKEVKRDLSRILKERRVVQHIPSDRSGVVAELNPWRVVGVKEDKGAQKVILRQKTSVVEGTQRKYQSKVDESNSPQKLLGYQPKHGQGKLAENKSVLVVGENYGLALDPTPTIIPFMHVQDQLNRLKEANGGKPIRVLRKGMLISVECEGKRRGIWKIYSIKGSLLVDLVRPDVIGRPSKGDNVWRDASMSAINYKELNFLPKNYCGHSGQ